ncbi:MAG: hypothetical protein LBP77_00130 [Rickettsiales bacterium]|nr:hypothetical protein [Rickettsiales bacterium]
MRFSKEKREAFNKSFYELLENSFKNINEKDEKGETILHKVARMSTREKVSFLVKKGADVRPTDSKKNSSHACWFCCWKYYIINIV